MFTGIVEEIGTVASMGTGSLEIQAQQVLAGTKPGDSIAVNGVCLTVTDCTVRGFRADVMPETIRRTALAALHNGSQVNLERALLLTSRLGGHIVSGHVDGVGSIQSIREEKNARILQVAAAPALLRYIVVKGSVALDGVSLTVIKTTPESFSVSLIPHTRRMTILHGKKMGDIVNIENDLIAKYVEKMLGLQGEAAAEQPAAAITREWLQQYGF